MGDSVQFRIPVLNRSNGEVVIVGAATRCSCLSISNLPLYLAKSETGSVEGTLSTRQVSDNGPFEQSVTLFTNSEDVPKIDVKVRGNVGGNAG